MTPIIGITASSITASTLGNFESIATVVVGSGGSATITFSNIPTTYTHLQIRGMAIATTAGGVVYANYNNDSGSNYSRHRLVGYGTGVDSFGAANQTTFSVLGDFTGTGASPVSSGIIIDVLDYANTNKYKTTRILSGVDRNGSGEVALISSLWRDTSAINEIDLTIGGSVATFAQHSHFALYGIKG